MKNNEATKHAIKACAKLGKGWEPIAPAAACKLIQALHAKKHSCASIAKLLNDRKLVRDNYAGRGSPLWTQQSVHNTYVRHTKKLLGKPRKKVTTSLPKKPQGTPTPVTVRLIGGQATKLETAKKALPLSADVCNFEQVSVTGIRILEDRKHVAITFLGTALLSDPTVQELINAHINPTH